MTLRDFGWPELWFLLFSARWTISLSLIAFAGGGALGLVVAACRVAPSAALRRAAVVWIRVFQGTPLLVQLLIMYYGTSFLGFRPDAWVAASVTFIVNSSAFFGEIWRGCIEAIPFGQWDGARALGLRFTAALRLVILPQAMRLMIPPTIGYMVQIVKTTSVASLIGIAELTRTAVMVNTVTFEPVRVFGTVTLAYFLMCWPLSLLAERMARRMDAKRATGIGELFRRRKPRRRPAGVPVPGMGGI
jgi:polar amino acid transport system permease protein